jgi:hypothetical protein
MLEKTSTQTRPHRRAPETGELALNSEDHSIEAPLPAPVLLGQIFARRYLIEELIDDGGMGRVYCARQQPLGRKVALKILSDSQRQDANAAARFSREARALSKLQHPNIVNFIDHGREGEHHFIVMEHIEGETLRKRLDQQGPLPLEEFLPIALQLLDGVGAAHARGVIHRDLKPDNVMLCPRRGQAPLVKLLDFGLARSLSPEDEVTRQGLMGSVLYLAPERITGGALTARADVYALGVLFYHMLSGCYPISGDSDFNILMAHVKVTPRPLAEVLPRGHAIPEELQAMIAKALSKKQDDRQADANEMLEAFVQLHKHRHLRQHMGALPQPHVSGRWASRGPAAPFFDMPTAIQETAKEPEPAPLAPQPAPQAGVIMVQPPQEGGRAALLMALATLVVGMFCVLALVAHQAGVFSRGGAAAVAAAPTASQELLDRAEALIQEGRYGEAEFLVHSIDPDAQRQPAVLVRLAGVRERLESGQNLTSARNYLDHGELDMARDAYERVLRREPSNLTAQQGLERVRALQKEAKQRRDAAAAPAPTPPLPMDEEIAPAAPSKRRARPVAAKKPLPLPLLEMP